MLWGFFFFGNFWVKIRLLNCCMLTHRTKDDMKTDNQVV